MERKCWLKQSRQENLIYLVVWGLLFAAPLLSLYVRTVSGSTVGFDWAEVFVVWRRFAVFLLLFLVHNFLLAPLLVYRHRRIAYFSIVAVVIAAFTVYQCSSRPGMKKLQEHRPPMAQEGEPPALPPDGEPPHSGNRPPRMSRPADAPPPIVGEHDIMAVVMLILMFGANVGVKGYVRSRDDLKRLTELEHENLEQQLEYLRYQINPHFFMNTLNNIHALVDIDPEKAKDTILKLSRIMRYVLYKSDRQFVHLCDELEFIQQYFALMQMRYTEKVKISLELPQNVPDRQIPPLILITFIENAFKHGVSYQHESFVEVKVLIEDDKLRFFCRNSKAENPNAEKGGVGLANVRKRLNLLYDHSYTLRTTDSPEEYSVELVITLKSSNSK